MGGDNTAPAIIIEPNDRGIDLGISYRGQLLFDYRPGGVGSRETIVQIVEQHLERIQRYCSRFFRFAGGQLNRVYLVGNPEDVEQVRYQFMSSRRLTAEVINPTTTCGEWSFSDALVANPFYVAPLGSALVDAERLKLPPDERGFPDLMDAVRSGTRTPLWPLVRQHLWPVAAAGILGAIVYSGAFVKHTQAGSVEDKLATIEAESGSASMMRLEMEHLGIRAQYLKQLDVELKALPVDELLAQVGKAKNNLAVCLDDVLISQDGTIVIGGRADTNDVMHQFDAGLKSIPLLRGPRIESALPITLPTSDDGVKFMIKAKFAGSNDPRERGTKNG
jgi:hypothetical protein